MTKILITGSTEGLGYLAAQQLLQDGNEVVLHARNQKRYDDVLKKLPVGTKVITGDLGIRSEVESIAKQANEIGTFDAVIYNAGVDSTDSGLTFKVNDLAPYLLTALLNKPKRIVYLSSSMHQGAGLDINNLEKTTTYSSSKLQILLLTKTLARLHPDISINAVDPGWVPTRMGGRMAPDSLAKGYATQVWLATNNTQMTGEYLHHMKQSPYDQRVDDVKLQDHYLHTLEQISGIKISFN